MFRVEPAVGIGREGFLEDLLVLRAGHVLERLGGDSIAPLVMQLIDQKRLSKKEAAEIRKLLDKYSR